MLRKKTKKDYLAPKTVVSEVDLEGLLCYSRWGVQVDPLENMNDPEDPEGAMTDGGPSYFAS